MIRFIKQSYEPEDIRVLTYDRIRDPALLVFARGYFAAGWLEQKTKLEILASHLLKAAKRLFGRPEFRYDAISDGIEETLWRVGQGAFSLRGREAPHHPQLPLFDA